MDFRILITTFLLTFLTLAGCLEEEESQDAKSKPSRGELRMVLTLEDMQRGTDWALLELNLSRPGDVEWTYEETFPLDPPLRRCVSIYMDDQGISFPGGPDRLVIASSPSGGAVVDENYQAGGTFSVTSTGGTPSAHAGLHWVLFAYNDVGAWRDAGALASLEVTSQHPFESRVVATGTTTCITELHQFPEGEFVHTPGATHAQGLTVAFDVQGSAYGLVSAGADVSYRFKLEGPDGLLADFDGGAMEPQAHAFLSGAPAGRYVASIPRMEGQSMAGAAIFVLDLPPNKDYPFFGHSDAASATPLTQA